MAQDVPWEWTHETESAFRLLKKKLVSAPILGYPDPTLPYILDTDASQEGVGAVLSQIQEGVERPIAYYSKTLAPAERNYCVTRKELLAVVKSMKHFRPYLYGREFLLRSDHASLAWLCRRKEPSCQVARWLETLSEFQYKLEHRAGRKHGNADGLSRQACVDCRQCQKIEERDGGPSRQEMGTTSPSPGGPDISQLDRVRPVDRADHQLRDRQQQADTDVGVIYQAIKDQRVLSMEEISSMSGELMKLAGLMPMMHLRSDGVLMVRVLNGNRTTNCAVCPEIQRSDVIWSTHQQAHTGVIRTLRKLRITWYWPGMTADVRRLVGTCEVCQVAKNGGLPGVAGRRRLYAGRPWQRVAIDLVGPMPTTPRGNNWILVITDHFTR
jgi:hypothetical protein